MRDGHGIRHGSALAGLEPALDFVDHIDPALAPDQAVGPMATAQRFQGVTDFHDGKLASSFWTRAAAVGMDLARKLGVRRHFVNWSLPWSFAPLARHGSYHKMFKLALILFHA
jgi:hypothetical protein